MDITEVRIKLMDDPHERLQAFCSITFDECFVIRDLKIIQGTKGSFVAMPSRKLTDRCPCCGTKNHLRAQYCNQCGVHLDENRAIKDADGRAKLYADIAHPINSECREKIQEQVIKAYEEELIKAQLPGYICTYDDYGEDNYATLGEDEEGHPVQRNGEGNGSTRRYEIPGHSHTHKGPHHLSNDGNHRSERVTASLEPRRSGNHSEDFGDGLV